MTEANSGDAAPPIFVGPLGRGCGSVDLGNPDVWKWDSGISRRYEDTTAVGAAFYSFHLWEILRGGSENKSMQVYPAGLPCQLAGSNVTPLPRFWEGAALSMLWIRSVL